MGVSFMDGLRPRVRRGRVGAIDERAHERPRGTRTVINRIAAHCPVISALFNPSHGDWLGPTRIGS